jgi:hypothetical protein
MNFRVPKKAGNFKFSRRTMKFSGAMMVHPDNEDRDGLQNVVFSPLNHTTRLIAGEIFITVSRQESNRSS